MGSVSYFGGALGPCGDGLVDEAGPAHSGQGALRRAQACGLPWRRRRALAPSLAPASGGEGQRAAGCRAGQAAALRGSPTPAGLTLGPEGERDPAKDRALWAHAPCPLPPGPGLDPLSSEVGARAGRPTQRPETSPLPRQVGGARCALPQSQQEWAAWRVSEPGAGAEGGLRF